MNRKLKLKKALLLVLSILTLILEILPYGAVMNFANPEGEPWRRTYSYFSLTPFGYAHFGPLITAVLTCVLLIVVVLFLFRPGRTRNRAILYVSGFATAASLLPWLYGIRFVSVIGVIITILLTGVFVLCFVKENKAAP